MRLLHLLRNICRFAPSVALALFFCQRAALCDAQANDSYIIENVTIIDGTGKPEQPHQQVTIIDGVIKSIAPAVKNSAVRGQHMIDGTGKFLVPGLWDVHVHLSDVGREAIPIYIAYGVTSVRDMGGDVAKLKDFKSQIASGDLVGPRIKFCGPMLEGSWDPNSVGGRTDHWPVANPDEARAVVNRLADEGVDCIKMRSYSSPETYFALAATARQRGIPFVGHAPGEIDPIESSNAGQLSYEHGFYPWPWDKITDEKKLQIENTFRKNGSLLVPTLIAWETFRLKPDQIEARVNDKSASADPRLRTVSPSLRKNWMFGIKDMQDMHTGTVGWNSAIDLAYEQIAEMHEHGVGVMAGTDTGVVLVFPGAALHEELELLVHKCRFTPMDALLAATIIPAKFFHLEAQLGTIQEGKIADLVLLAADPLVDIGNIDSIDGVMSRGYWFDRKALGKIKETTAEKVKLSTQNAN